MKTHTNPKDKEPATDMGTKVGEKGRIRQPIEALQVTEESVVQTLS